METSLTYALISRDVTLDLIFLSSNENLSKQSFYWVDLSSSQPSNDQYGGRDNP